MDRNRKIQLLKNIETGKANIKDLCPVAFVELQTIDEAPGIYFDKQGNNYTETEKDNLIEHTKQRAAICFVEIKQSNNNHGYIKA